MTLSLTLKKSLAFAVLATPLTLIACGSNGDDTEAAAAKPSTVTSEATPSSEAPKEETTEASSEKETTKKEEAKDPKESEAKAAAGDGAAENNAAGSDTLVNPFENGDIEVAEPAPVDGAQPANEGDSQAITGLVKGLYEQETMHSFLRYIPDHTCQRVMDQNGGGEFSLDGVPDMPMNQMAGWSETHVSDISDIKVNGDQASAVVTVQTAEGPDTATQRYQREGGQWTFCN